MGIQEAFAAVPLAVLREIDAGDEPQLLVWNKTDAVAPDIVATLLAEAHANIVDISQTTLREFFTMIMLVDMEKATVPFDELKRRLNAKGESMGLRIDAQHEDVFKFMHRV